MHFQHKVTRQDLLNKLYHFFDSVTFDSVIVFVWRVNVCIRYPSIVEL